MSSARVAAQTPSSPSQTGPSSSQHLEQSASSSIFAGSASSLVPDRGQPHLLERSSPAAAHRTRWHTITMRHRHLTRRPSRRCLPTAANTSPSSHLGPDLPLVAAGPASEPAIRLPSSRTSTSTLPSMALSSRARPIRCLRDLTLPSRHSSGPNSPTDPRNSITSITTSPPNPSSRLVRTTPTTLFRPETTTPITLRTCTNRSSHSHRRPTRHSQPLPMSNSPRCRPSMVRLPIRLLLRQLPSRGEGLHSRRSSSTKVRTAPEPEVAGVVTTIALAPG